jgi:hypothetical protein
MPNAHVPLLHVPEAVVSTASIALRIVFACSRKVWIKPVLAVVDTDAPVVVELEYPFPHGTRFSGASGGVRPFLTW